MLAQPFRGANGIRAEELGDGLDHRFAERLSQSGRERGAPSSNIWCRLAHDNWEFASDQPGAGAIGQVRPEPLDRDHHSVAHTRQEKDMDQAPYPPSRRARKAKAAEIGDCRLPPDRRKTARMAVTEGPRQLPAINASLDERSDVAALLFGGRREAGYRLAVPPVG
jgi:hypothetical protein